jgi:hypothetical protein
MTRRAAALLAALLLAGCSGTAAFDGPDPLTGGPPIQRRTSPAPTLAAGLSPGPSGSLPPAPAGQLPPVPVPSTATSQAALAGGQSQPLDSGSNLRIGIGTPTALAQEHPLWRSPHPPPPPAGRPNDPAPPAVVPAGAPAPVAPPPAHPGTPSSPAMLLSGGGAQAGALDQALQQLHAGRQVTWARLETLDKGGWSFQCAIANPTNPNAEFNYKATGTTELEAVRRVLDQIALEKH